MWGQETEDIPQQHTFSNMEQGTQQVHYPSFKLTRLEIPTFDGDRIKYTEFWAIFSATIDQNRQLSGKEKFMYLKNRLAGQAKQAISCILVSNENYTVATTLLKDRFEDTQFSLYNHYMALINLSPATNSSKELRLMYDQLKEHF